MMPMSAVALWATFHNTAHASEVVGVAFDVAAAAGHEPDLWQLLDLDSLPEIEQQSPCW
jgi:hypothetical protein